MTDAPNTQHDRLHEYQFVAMCAFSPELTDQYPDARRYLYLPESKSLFDAVKKLRVDDPLLLAGVMSNNGFSQATPEFVMTKMLIVGQTWPASDIGVTVSELRRLWQRRESGVALKDIEVELAAGKITPEQAAQQVNDAMMELIDPSTDRVLSSSDWLASGEAKASERAALVKSGLVPRFSKALPTLRTKVRMELDTMIVVTGPTGGGKTIFGEMFAEELAESGQVAFYVCTELTKWQMMWRRIFTDRHPVREAE